MYPEPRTEKSIISSLQCSVNSVMHLMTTHAWVCFLVLCTSRFNLGVVNSIEMKQSSHNFQFKRRLS